MINALLSKQGSSDHEKYDTTSKIVQYRECGKVGERQAVSIVPTYRIVVRRGGRGILFVVYSLCIYIHMGKIIF